MSNVFSVERGQRIIVATTPSFPVEISGSIPGYIEYNGRSETRFDARRRYVESLLRPYRWLDTSKWDFKGYNAYDIDNAEAFYPQDGKLTGYGVNKLINYSDSSGPGNSAIHQYPIKSFHPVRVLNDMLSEMSSGTRASDERSTLAMFLISNSQFRERVLDLINLHVNTPIVPEVREGGQVQVISLGKNQEFKDLIKNIWRENGHDQSGVMLPVILDIPYGGKAQKLSLGELFPGFNLWNLDDVYYPVYRWNEMYREDGGHMEVQVDYKDISKSKLVINSINKPKCI